jgi:tetratricopeptide (TPR) repeat protein
MSQPTKKTETAPSPILNYLRNSGAFFSIFLWANHVFLEYRVSDNTLFAFLPILASILMYLWVVLLADEFLFLLENFERISWILKKLKLLSFGLIALYGAAALALWVNGISQSPAVSKKTKIISSSVINMGLFSYGHLTIAGWDGDPSPKKILSSDTDGSALHTGADIEISTGQGTLSLNRVLEIKPDREKSNLNMLKAAPDSQIALAALVEIHSRRKDFGKALEWFDKLQATYPRETGIGQDLAARLIDSRRYEEAIHVLGKLLQAERDYEILYLLGCTLARAGKKEEAEKVLREAAELDPADFRAFHSLGYLHRDAGRKEKAREAWTRVLELFPNFVEAQKNIEAMDKSPVIHEHAVEAFPESKEKGENLEGPGEKQQGAGIVDGDSDPELLTPDFLGL